MVTVHPTAIVSPKAEIEEGVQIGPYCIVGDRVHIGKGTVLEAFVRICDYVQVGENCRFFEHVTLGREPQDFDFKGEESWVILEKDVVLRENVTIHRASGEGKATRVGEGCYIMEGCHLGHNVELGPRVVMANKAGLSGYVHVGEKTVIGGMAGVHQFVHIGRNCMVGGLSKIVKDVPPFLLVDGHPARVYGLNKVGLRRNGFNAAARADVAHIYQQIYRGGLPLREALALLRQERSDDLAREILDFADAGSGRGLTPWIRS
jgi:UDP-N-acetylglucosamine acyltransferase